MTKNVLVTGCAGFIGFNLSKTLLKENHNVYGVDSLNNAYMPVEVFQFGCHV